MPRVRSAGDSVFLVFSIITSPMEVSSDAVRILVNECPHQKPFKVCRKLFKKKKNYKRKYYVGTVMRSKMTLIG